MNDTTNMGFLTVIAAVMIAACGQDDVVFPDAGSASTNECSECDQLYPIAGASGSYALKKDEVAPCLEWQSARIDMTDAVINFEDEYLDAANNAENDNRAIVIVVSAKNCQECMKLIGKISERVQDFEQAGAFFMAAAYTDLGDLSANLTLEEAEDLLLNEDGWPRTWPLTNDQEGHLKPLGSLFPQLIVIRMNDMTVYSTGNGNFGGNNGYDSVEELISTVQGFPDVAAPAQE